MLPCFLLAVTLPARSCIAHVSRSSHALNTMSSVGDRFKFDGEAAELYSTFKQLAPSWNKQVDAVRHNTLASPKSILDIASGPGQPAILLAQLYPDATVLSTDLSPDMVAQAKKNAADLGLTNMKCEVLDMQDMKAVGSETVDVCTASFGYMFAPSIDKALAETHRVLRPGGLMAATVWVDNAMPPLYDSIMTEVLGHPPPPLAVDPMLLGQGSNFADPLAAAGFTIITDETGTLCFEFDSDPDVSWRSATLPLIPKLKELHDSGEHGDVLTKARDAFARATAAWKDPASARLVSPPATYRLTVARKNAA